MYNIYSSSPRGGMKEVTMKKLFLLIFVVVLVACSTVTQAASPETPETAVNFDPSILIGTYSGEWKWLHYSEKAELKITKITDGFLVGEIIYYGRSGITTNRWWKFTDGRLEGMVLIFNTNSGASFSLTITSKKTLRLEGKSTGLMVNAEFEFEKNKK